MAFSGKEGTITALSVQKRNTDRVSVFLDGEFAFGLSSASAAGLCVGQSLSAEQVDDLQQLAEIESAANAAYRLVGQRPRSVAEISRRLRDKGYEVPVIEQVVSKLKSMDLLDDVAFGRYWIEQRETFKPRSRFALSQELRQKGLSPEMIENLLAELDEEELARRAARKQLHRWDSLPKDRFQQRMAGYLRRRGFDFATVKLITDEMWLSVAETMTDDRAT